MDKTNRKHYQELQAKCNQMEQAEAQNLLDHDDKDTKYKGKLKIA